MNTIELNRATVTVQYVNPPKGGKKSGTIKDVDGQMFGVWPDKLAMFQPGETYEIEFTEKNVAGTIYRDVKSAQPAAPAPPPPPAPRQYQRAISGGASPAPGRVNGHASAPAAPQQAPALQYYRPTAPRDAERMFVCAILGACIKTGRVELGEDTLVNAVNVLRSTWQATFGMDEATAP